jgi:hypothetical protein
VYAKADGRNWILLSPGSTWGYAWFDISAGAVGTVIDGGGSTTASITNAGNGWYRCVVSATAVDARGLQVLLANANNVVTYTGNGTSGIYLWGAQLEQSATVGEYIPTTSTINSAPRFDHNPTTGESLGLLVEEQRTNLLLRSEEFQTTWTVSQLLAFGSGSVVDATTAPNGTLTADRITESTATAQHFVNQAVSGISASSTITASCYVKFDSPSRNFSLQVTDAPNGGSGYAELYLTQSGVVTSPTPSTFTNRTATVENVGSGWYRVRLTITTAAVTTITIRLFIVNDSNSQVYLGDGTSGIYLWGAQLEAGAFPTSYIPTTPPPSPAAADVASITGSRV